MIANIVIDCNRFTFSLTNFIIVPSFHVCIVLFQQVKFLRTADPLSQCSWYTGGSTTRAASSDDTCGGELDPCTPGGSTGQGSCCAGKNCNFIHPDKAAARGVPKGGHYCEDPTLAAAFEKELKLVEEKPDVCIEKGDGGPEGKCGCYTASDNTHGTACCGNLGCSYVLGSKTKSGVGGFYCYQPGEEDVAVEIN